MSEVFKIGITKKNNQDISAIQQISLLAGKGIVGDRYFHEYNDVRNQLTLIESENINYYNKRFNLNIPYLNFRRNIVTKGIELNNLVGKELLINQTKIKVVDLCRPCKPLQQNLGQDNIIKEFLRRGGIRCQILTSSQIKIGDSIKLID